MYNHHGQGWKNDEKIRKIVIEIHIVLKKIEARLTNQCPYIMEPISN